MAAVYRFRITFEEFDDVYREIEIKSTQTFFDFHNAIQKAIGFDNTKDASFFMSDDNWGKNNEVALYERKGQKVRMMDAAKVSLFIEQPRQKILYLFDPEKEWTFLIELIKITEENAKVSYPACVRQIGMAPKQYKNVTPPVPDEDEEEELPTDKKEKIFTSEEGYDEEEKDEDMMEDGAESEEGEEKGEEEETAEHGEESDEI
jgi:hypothetical protein